MGLGEAAPLEPYDGVPLAAVRAALDAYAVVARRARRGRAAGGVPGRARPAAGARRGRPRALGPRGQARRAAGGGADLGRGGALDPGQRDDRRRGPRGRGRRGGGRGAGRLRHDQGQGRDRRRRRAGSRRCGRRSGRGWRSGSTPTAPGRSTRRSPSLRALAPVGIELAEEPVHGVEALRAVRAEVDVPLAMDETAAEEGAAGLGRDRRGVPEDRALRRDHRRPARRRRGADRRARSSTWPRPTTGRWGSPPRSTPRPGLTAGGPLPAHGLATLDRLRGAGRPPARGARRDPRAARAGPGGRVTRGRRHHVVPRDDRARRSSARRGRWRASRPARSPAPTPALSRRMYDRGRRAVAVDRPARLGHRALAGAPGAAGVEHLARLPRGRGGRLRGARARGRRRRDRVVRPAPRLRRPRDGRRAAGAVTAGGVGATAPSACGSTPARSTPPPRCPPTSARGFRRYEERTGR